MVLKVAVTPETGKGTELSKIMAGIRKSMGDKVLFKGNEVPDVQRIPTGLFEFDNLIGGGFPRGRISMIYGPESSCKSNLAYLAMAAAQRLPPPCNVAVLIDLEDVFDPVWAARLGVDVEKLVLVKPGFGEQAMDLIDALVQAEDVAFLLVDSLAMVIATKEIQQSSEKFDVGTAAILIKRMCNKMVLALSEERKRGHEPAVVFVNQIRYKVGVMFGDPETVPGGKTQMFLASLIIRVYGKPVVDKSTNIAWGKEVTALIKKAKVKVFGHTVEFTMALTDVNGLKPGQSDSWNAVSNHLKQSDLLKNTGKGWMLEGKLYPTLVPIKERYLADPHFAETLQALVTNSQGGAGILVEATGAAATDNMLFQGKTVDPATGEIK